MVEAAIGGQQFTYQPSEPRSAGPPTLCGLRGAMRRMAPAACAGRCSERLGGPREPYQGPARPPHPFHQRSKTPMGVEAPTPCPRNVPSRMLQTPLCSKGGDLSSRWRPRELCDQSMMSAYRTCKGRCAWRARMLAWMQGEGNRVIRAPGGAHKRGAAAATGVGRRLSAAWCGPCPSHALPADVSVCSAFQRSHDGHNASSVHA